MSRRGLTACLLAVVLSGCAGRGAPPVVLGPDDTVKAAQQLLTDRCLARQGLVPPRPGAAAPPPEQAGRVVGALFGTGRAELSLTLPGGQVIRQHSDGCLAAAQRRLYGDQKRWFLVSTRVNNLRSAAPAADRAEHRRLRERALERSRALLAASGAGAEARAAARTEAAQAHA
ncbi:hypothetical protein ACIO3O_36625 [Streptomyces sp. NPDC087440]|uniref:hypothetical protein n=1 Tax=Streptomyces sp. NPDC087440 TaxID=3365790 RepID=UPI003830D7A0